MNVRKIAGGVIALTAVPASVLWFLLEHDNNLDFGEISYQLGNFPNTSLLALGAFVASCMLAGALIFSGRKP